MSPTVIRRLDATIAALLWIWVGMGLGFGALVAPELFNLLPSHEEAGRVAGAVVRNLDLAAWIIFGAAFLIIYGARWLAELDDKDFIGPLRLWAAAALAALLLTMTSWSIISPKLTEIHARMNAPVESLAADNPDRVAYDKAHSASRQLFFLRLLLAAGLAIGLGRLPKEKQA